MEHHVVKLSRRVGKVLEVYGVLGTHIKVLDWGDLLAPRISHVLS